MLIDFVIALFLIMALFRGRDIGFVRQLFSTVGFFAGLFIGVLLQPRAIHLVHTEAARGVVTIVTVLGLALVVLTLGEYVGLRIKHRLQPAKVFNSYDNALGAVLSVVSLLLSIWLGASVLSSLPYPRVQHEVQKSAIIRILDAVLPSAPNLIDDLGKLVDPNGFPQVFIGTEPLPRGDVNIPSLGQLLPAVNKDKDSVVKIAGTGCGGIVEGSGFVLADGLVGTNAHVIAGIHRPIVQDSNGNHSGTPIWFDADLDFAILRVSNLAGKPLPIDANTVKSGTASAVLGYPGGGAFNAGPAAVVDNFTASGRNIYGKGAADRDIYELRADVIPGNSGGPLIDNSGTVIGVIFAESTSYKHVGYALTTPAINQAIRQAQARNQAVSTNTCTE